MNGCHHADWDADAPKTAGPGEESGMTGNKDGAKKAAPAEDAGVRHSRLLLNTGPSCSATHRLLQ